MIGKIIKNSMDFGGLVDYLEREMKHAQIIASDGVCIVNRDAIVESFRMQVEESGSRIGKPVGHIALSWHADDSTQLTNEFMAKVAQEYMEKMDIRNTQFIIARHFDTNHPHCHILYNRVDNDGCTISDSNIRLRNVAACRELNQKYKFTLGKKGDRRYQNSEKLKGKALARYQMAQRVLAARQMSRTWSEFKSNLERNGIKIMFRYGKDAGIKGIIFADDERSFGGSKLDASLSLKELDKAFGGLFERAKYCTDIQSSNQSERIDVPTNTKHHQAESVPTQVETLSDLNRDVQAEGEDGRSWMAIAFDVAMEMILQPNVEQASSASYGGVRKDNDWGARDDENVNHRTYKRRR
jgi:hypothetical protein